MRQNTAGDRIEKRTVLYFPGFEPLDAKAHHRRYARSAQQSGKTWDFTLDLGDLNEAASVSYFDVTCHGEDWRTASRVHVFDHNRLVRQLSDKPFARRLLGGYLAAARVVFQGGAAGYFRHAWRFGLFFVVPFLLMTLGMMSGVAIAALPYCLALPIWSYVASIPLAIVSFRKLFMPLADKFYTLHLFADWELAVSIGSLDQPDLLQWLDTCVAGVRTALREEADEYVIASHSMGSAMAVQVLGMLLEEDPNILAGKKLAFVTLGGAVLQSSLLRPAIVLRSRVGTIARAEEVSWLEIQCHTDPIHFYKTRVIALCGHADAPQANIAFIRIRTMLLESHYRKIRRDFLRVHRQYVMGSEKRSGFDFILMTAGPLPAASFAQYSQNNVPVI